MNENKKGQEDSEEEESIYEKEGKKGNTVETVICDPSRDLNKKVAYDRGSLNTVPTE